ncbi:hypothetical protein [Vibrio coralliirubri]|nr:hypothetical protein [Vibrio coralliirubri]
MNYQVKLSQCALGLAMTVIPMTGIFIMDDAAEREEKICEYK